jgi:hypothetical protein
MARPPKDGFDLYWKANGINREVTSNLVRSTTDFLDREFVKDGRVLFGPTHPLSPQNAAESLMRSV